MKKRYSSVRMLIMLINLFIAHTLLAGENLQIPSTKAMPTIDGIIDATWGAAPSTSIEHILVGNTPASSNISAYFKTLWDSTGLYVLAVVTDDVKIKDSESNEVWKDDAIEIYLDINNDKLTSYGATDYQYTFRWNDPVMYGNPSNGIEFKMNGTTAGYILEVKFPWNTLGVQNPKQDDLLGFDIHVQDDDNGGDRDNKIAWFTTEDNSWQNPSLFATARLINNISTHFVAEDPKISVDEGFYTKPFDVVISTASDKMNIWYTLDGSDPENSNFVIVVPSPAKVRIDPQNTLGRGKTPGVVLRARAKGENYDFSPVVTKTYLFIDKLSLQTSNPGHDWPYNYYVNGQTIELTVLPSILEDSRYKNIMGEALKQVPTISLATDNRNLFSSDSGIYVNAQSHGIEWERPVSVELINPDGSNGFHIDAGLRIRGGYSRTSSFRKHAFRLFFREKYGESKLNYPLFEDEGVKSFDKIDLRCAQNYSWSKGDGEESPLYTFTRDVFSRDLQGKMGQFYTRSRYYHLYLNGLYWGLYQSQERSEANYAESYMGGDKSEYDVLKRASEGEFVEATDGNMDTWKEIWDLCGKGFSSNADYYRLQGLDEKGVRDPKLKVLVDIDNLIDYMNIIFYTGNFDAPVSAWGGNTMPNNFYAIYNHNGEEGFKFIAHDNEHTLIVDPISYSTGITANRVSIGRVADQSGKMVIKKFEKFNPQWLHFKLSENAEYRQRFSDRSYKQYFNQGVFTPSVAAELFKMRTDQIDTAVIAESARWGEDQYGSIMTKDDNWQPSVDNIMNRFFPFRTNIVIRQLKTEELLSRIQAPIFIKDNVEITDTIISLAIGGALTIFDPDSTGNIFYSLDGTDPRIVGDGVSSTAINGGKSTSIAVLQNCLVKARVFTNGKWSSIHTLMVAVDSENNGLQLTEIQYNPIGQNGIAGKEFEFIELKNNSKTPMNLTSCRFIDGISYAFPKGTVIEPDNFIVLASSSFSFSQRYGMAASGEYEGQLSNGGERITLVGAIGDTLISVKYDNKQPWPVTADSLGFSLVPAVNNLSADWNDGRNWRASSRIAGSPFADDVPEKIPGIIINEILANSVSPEVDAIELYNPGNTDASIGGWYLSNNHKVPSKWKIPTGTVIPANGYITFYEGHYVNSTLQFNANEFGSAFSLSELGEEVYLFSGTPAGELTGYENGYKFGASDPGVSFGRYINSIGKEHFVAQESASFNAVNSLPKVGPVVINQIMYNPTADQYEFIELLNTSPSVVNLYNETNQAPWIIEGIDFTFPAQTSVAPGQSVYIAGKDITPSDFRAIFDLDSNAIVFNFNTKLRNEGEEITLLKSYKSYIENNEEKISYIRIDKVNYNDNNLWPDADGNGYALLRVAPTAYGNDPANWMATPPGMRIKNSFLPDATEGVYYSRELIATCGNAPYTWSTTSGILPDGLTLNPVTGLIDGTPVQAGSFPVSFKVEDANSVSKVVDLTLKVNPNTAPVAINDTTYTYKNMACNVYAQYNDTDLDGDMSSWKVSITQMPTHGTAIVNNDNSITYFPEKDYMGTDELTYQVSDTKGSSEAKVTIYYYERIYTEYAYQWVTASSNDAEENIKTKEINLTNKIIRMGKNTSGEDQLVGLRFTDLADLKDSIIIRRAFIYFVSASAKSDSATFTIQGEASVAPEPFSSTALISSRKTTNATVTWQPGPWNFTNDTYYSYQSADVTSILIELKSLGWKPENPLAFIIKGTGTRGAFSFDKSEGYSPTLYVLYTDLNAPVPVPVASIKKVAPVSKFEQVILDGSQSYTDDYRSLNYHWTLVSKPEGSQASLSNPSSMQPSFVTDQFGDYVVSLQVDNGEKSSETVFDTIQAVNQAPVANAGSDQTRCHGSVVKLTGKGSSDPNGDNLTYQWSFIQKPEGSLAELSSTTVVNPKFTADKEGKYTFGLTVADNFSISNIDYVDISVIANQPPVAIAGENREMVTGSIIELDGARSTDPENDKLSYLWKINSKPASSKLTLTDSTSAKISIKSDTDGDYSISLIVSDGVNSSSADEVMISSATNQPPVALAGDDQTITEHTNVALDGSDSFDPENKAIFYQWSFVSKPFGSIASITNANTAKPTFLPDTEGNYSLLLKVSDGTFTAEDQVQITALNDVSAHLVKDFKIPEVYPNPFTDRLVVNYETPVMQKVNFTLYNLSGAKIKTFTFESSGKCTRVLDVGDRNLEKGIYLLIMTPENGEPHTIKIIH